jgi:hypothetical protein
LVQEFLKRKRKSLSFLLIEAVINDGRQKMRERLRVKLAPLICMQQNKRELVHALVKPN